MKTKADKYLNINNYIIKEIFNLLFQNNFYFGNFHPLSIEKVKELSFVENKINNYHSELNEILECESYDKEFNDLIKNKYIILEKEFKSNKKMQSKKNENYLTEYDSKHKSKKYFINEINQNYKYLYNNLKNILSQHFTKKEKINQTKISNNYQNINQILDSAFNSKIKINKNNKMVYMNSFLFWRKIKKTNIFLRKKRSSKYRGVSKNGNHWQTLMMNNRNKSYIGTYNSEEIAARIYDFNSIKKKGINAKTNFIYNNKQIQNILLKEIDFKEKDIDEKIKQLINEK